MALLESIPRVDLKGQKLVSIAGLPPNLMRIPPGCAFHPRCPMAKDVCTEKVPPLLELGGVRTSACLFAEDLYQREGVSTHG